MLLVHYMHPGRVARASGLPGDFRMGEKILPISVCLGAFAIFYIGRQLRRPSRLPAGDTADCQSALLGRVGRFREICLTSVVRLLLCSARLTFYFHGIKVPL